MSKALATKNVAAVLVAVALVFGFAFAFAQPAKADTISDLQAQIQALLAQITALQTGGSIGAPAVSGAGCYTFTRNHQQGNTGGEVMWVQQFLNNHDAQVAASGAGSPGNETDYFGSRTKAAVAAFQNMYAADILAPVGLSAGTGYWGPSSRAKANALCAGAGAGAGAGTGTTPVPVTGSLNVSAGAQPANSLAPQGAIRVPFTTFTLSNGTNGPVTVTGVTVQRAGLAQDAVFAGIALVDSNGLQVGISKTLNSNHQAVVGDTFTLQAGQSVTLTVAGNMASSLSSYAGQVAALSVVGINTSVPVSGSLPITGASQVINASLTVGSVTTNIGSFDPGATGSKNIGDTGIKFSGVRFTAGSAEDLKLYSIRWRQAGSVGAGDLANVVTVVDGTSYPAIVSADGKFFTSTFSGGILIQKGYSVEVHAQGDIVGSNSASRTVEFDVDKTSDVYLVGQLYGYGVAPGAGTGSVDTDGTNNDTTITSGTPWFQGSTFSITGVSVTTIQKATEVPSQNVAINVQNQVLGGFVIDLKGEAITVGSMIFGFDTSSNDSATNLTNVSLVDENGAVVAGPVDGAALGGNAGNDGKVTFTDSVTFQSGRHVYTLKGKLGTAFSNGDTIIATTTPSSHWTSITGQTTGNTVTLSNGLVTMSTMTVRAAALTITMSSQPSSQNIVAGGQNILFANLQLDASASGEDVRISNFKLIQTGTIANLTSCQVFDGATALNTGSNVPSALSASGADTTFTLDNQLTIAKGTIKTIGVKCNVVAGSTGTHVWSIDNADSWASTGVQSGNSLTLDTDLIVTDGSGGTMTIDSGSLTVSLDASSPSYSIAAAGTNGVTLSAYKLRPANEAVWLNKLGVTLTNTASSSASDLVTLYVYQGSTQLGIVTFTGSNTTATSTFASPVLLAKDADTIITIKGDLAAQGTGQSGTAGHKVAVDYNSADSIGQNSGTNIQGSGSSASAGVRIFKSYPVFTYSSASGSVINGTNDLLALTVTAPAAGPVKLYKLVFGVSTTTATLTSVAFSGPSGNVASTSLTYYSSGSTGTITVFFDSTSNTADAEVAAGTPKVYTLRGTVGGLTSSTAGSVAVALKADTGYPSLANGTFMSPTATTTLNSANIIWSPMTTTSPAITTNDWTNGYGLPGCFTSAGLGNDCTARVLAQ